MTKVIAFEIDSRWQAEIENYNTYRSAVIEALAENNRLYAATPRDEKAIKRSNLKLKKARAAYSNASMSMGWRIAEVLKAQGVELVE